VIIFLDTQVSFFFIFIFIFLLHKFVSDNLKKIFEKKMLSKLALFFFIFSVISARSIVDLILEEPELGEAKKWGQKTGLIENMDISQYGSEISLIIPSNTALRRYETEFPGRKEHLQSDEDDLQTLMLLAATDHAISPEDIKAGLYEDDDSLVSLLSQTASISKEGLLCLSPGSRASCSDEKEPCCAQIDLNKTFKADDGYIFLIERVLHPDELIDKFKSMGI